MSTYTAGDTGDESWIPDREYPLEEGLATHASVLAWRTPRLEEPGGYTACGCRDSDLTEAN